MDRRATAEVDWVRATLDMERLAKVTGNGVDSYYGYTKMLWLKNRRPDVFGKTRWFVPPNAFVIHALTGELAVDRSSAGNIGGVLRSRGRDVSGEMLDTLGIPRDMMPPRLVASTDVVGGLTANAAERLGLRAGTPVIAGGVDAASGNVRGRRHAPGAARRDDRLEHVLGLHHARRRRASRPRQHAVRVRRRARHVRLRRRDHGGRRGHVVPRRARARRGGCSARAWRRRARRARRGSARDRRRAEGVLFLPYLMGERSPIWDAKASGAFAGLSLYHRRAHLYRAVLEGVTFALRHNIEAGARGAASLDEPLIVVGGAAHSDLWMQIIADVTARPVLTIAEDVEAAMGAALLAAYGAKLVSADDVRRGWVTLAPACAAARGADGGLRPDVRVLQGALPCTTIDDARPRRSATAADVEDPPDPAGLVVGDV
jgi:sugar (pentulose or hexulose) kinase